MSIQTSMADCALEPFTLDWSEFYERHGLDTATDLITSSVWTVIGGTAGNEFIDTPRTTIELSGGTIGDTIQAKNTIEINGGAFRDCRVLSVRVF